MCAGLWATVTVLFASRILPPAGSPSPPSSLSFSSSSVKRSRACAAVHGKAARVLRLVQNAPMTRFPLQVGVFPLLAGPGGLLGDLGVSSAHVTDGSSGVGVRRRRARRLLATQGQLRQRHGLMGEALRGQHGKGVTWRAKANAQNKPRYPRNRGAPRQAATHCQCTRGGPPCAPAPDCRRASNVARRAGTRVSWTEGDLGEPRYAEACAFYVLLCSFETTPMKTQRNKTSWSSTAQNKSVHLLSQSQRRRQSASEITTPSGGQLGQISGLPGHLQTRQIQRPSQE